MTKLRSQMAALCAVLLATGVARAESPLSMWQTIPLLPDVAETANCAETDDVATSIEAAAAKALTDAQMAMAGMAPSAVTDEQGKAIERLTDYSLQQCAIDAETDAWDLVQTSRENLAEAINALESRRIAALDKCGSEMTPGYDACYSRTRTEYPALARDTANHHLDAIGNLFADWRDRTRTCLERRETAVRAFDAAGVAGPFAAHGLNVRTQTWMLVGLHAQMSKELCDAVFEASHLMDID